MRDSSIVVPKNNPPRAYSHWHSDFSYIISLNLISTLKPGRQRWSFPWGLGNLGARSAALQQIRAETRGQVVFHLVGRLLPGKQCGKMISATSACCSQLGPREWRDALLHASAFSLLDHIEWSTGHWQEPYFSPFPPPWFRQKGCFCKFYLYEYHVPGVMGYSCEQGEAPSLVELTITVETGNK